MGKQMSFLGLILGWMLVVASYYDGVPKLFSHFLSIVMGVATFVFVDVLCFKFKIITMIVKTLKRLRFA